MNDHRRRLMATHIKCFSDIFNYIYDFTIYTTSPFNFNNMEFPDNYFSNFIEGISTKGLVQISNVKFDNSTILICFYNNFAGFVEKWMNHYISIGIKNYVLVDNNSNDKAIAKRIPSVLPAVKPIPKSNPSIKISTATAINKLRGSLFSSILLGLSSLFSVSLLAPIIIRKPKVNPIISCSGACVFTISGNISTATTEKTTPAAKCNMRLLTLPPGFRNKAMKPPVIIVKTGIKENRIIF